MLLWCLWLLATWVIAILGNTGLPPIRWMILSAMLGLTLAWPLLRLMQELPSTGSAEASPRTTRVRLPDALRDADSSATSSAHAGVGGDAAASCDISKPRAWDVMRLILRDWLAMILVFQVVVWPLRLTAMWSTGQAIVLDGSVAAWSLLVGAIIAWGCMGDRPSRRTLAMVAIVLLLFGEPLAMAIININATRGQGITWPMRVSPLETVWLSTGAPADWIGAPWIERTIAAGVAAVLAWAALGISQWFLPSNNVPAVTNELP